MRARRQSGFTLIEILVALAVLGMLIAGLGQGITAGLHVWRTAMKMTDASDSLDTVDRALRRVIAHMDPGTATEPPKFSAKADSLAFITTLPDMPAMATSRVQASLGVDARRRLVLRWRPYIDATHPPSGAFDEIELLGGVQGIGLTYWAADTGWTADWQSENMPTLIRIRLKFGRPGQRPWPDIVVAPELDRP